MDFQTNKTPVCRQPSTGTQAFDRQYSFADYKCGFLLHAVTEQHKNDLIPETYLTWVLTDVLQNINTCARHLNTGEQVSTICAPLLNDCFLNQQLWAKIFSMFQVV